jgi:riboflavin transporter FmnP
MKGDFFMSNLTRRRVSAQKLKKLVVAAVFCALAFVSMFIMRINVMFLTFDAKDAVVTIAGLLLGPLYSLAISVAVPIIESITLGDTGFWGLLMDLLSTMIFSCTCALIYKHKKNIKGAVVGLVSAVLAMTAFMILFNLFIVPIYTPNFTTAAVAEMVPTLFLPFNLTKGTLNAAIVLILYKPASTALKATKVLPSKAVSETDGTEPTLDEKKNKNLKFSLTVTAIGIAVVAICLIVFFTVLDGTISFGK